MLIAVGFISQSAFAMPRLNCETKALGAAVKKVSLSPNRQDDGYLVTVQDGYTVRVSGTTRTYKVTVHTEYNDGASSTDLGNTRFSVLAVGTADSCMIKRVTILN